jgi:hypothetical protein
MAVHTKEFLSASVNGRGILLAATVTPGTLIHTAHATSKDEVWLWLSNASGADIKATIEWGGVTVPNDLKEITIPFEGGPVLVIPGWALSGGLLVRGFAASANQIIADGYVNRIT